MSQTKISAEPNTPFLTIEREFDAPIERVFQAFVDRDLVEQWLGPQGYTMETPVWDARTGGAYSYIHTDPQGQTYEFRGSFHSVDAPHSIIQTFEFVGYPGAVNLEKMTFEDAGNGRTRIVQHSVCGSVEERDGMVASGMESGVREGYEKLDELLAKKA